MAAPAAVYRPRNQRLSDYYRCVEDNKNGGKLKDSIGIPEDQLRNAARSAVCKINIDSDGRLVMTAKIRRDSGACGEIAVVKGDENWGTPSPP